MKPIQNIHLAFACREERDKNNFCNKCSRQIHDFRNSTADELATAMQNSARPVCGIFNRSQLNRTFVELATATLIAGSLSACSIAQEPENKIQGPSTEISEAPIFGMIAETVPTYKDGIENLMGTIRQHLRHPKDCGEGTVYVSFVVNKDGTVSDKKILKGISEKLNQEALRVIDFLTEWTPGQQGGKKVDVRMILPVKFTMELQQN
jgi:TonB family protein